MSRTFAIADGDWVIEANGQPKMIDGISKAGQDVVHALSHPYDRDNDFGFDFLGSVQVVEAAAAAGILRRDVSNAVARLQAKQARLGSRLDASERITGVKQVVVTREGAALKYVVQFGVGRLTTTEVSKAFIITNRHRL